MNRISTETCKIRYECKILVTAFKYPWETQKQRKLAAKIQDWKDKILSHKRIYGLKKQTRKKQACCKGRLTKIRSHELQADRWSGTLQRTEQIQEILRSGEENESGKVCHLEMYISCVLWNGFWKFLKVCVSTMLLNVCVHLYALEE